MRLGYHDWKCHCAALAVFVMTLAVNSSAADQTAANETRALTNWATAATGFQKAGAYIGPGKYKEAEAELNSCATNLPPPYAGMAGQFRDRLNSTLKQWDNPKDPRRIRALVQLCTDLRAYGAVSQMQGKAGSDDDPGEDASSAWRLYETGDTKAALAEYQRKLADEQVEMWKDYYQKQIRLIEQRPANLTNVAYAIEMVHQRYQVGYEVPADPFDALRELTRALPCAKSPKEAAAVQQLIIKILSGLGDDAGRDAWEDHLLRESKADSEACASVYLDRGLRAYEKKDYPAALALFRKVCAEYPDAEAYGDAQYSEGLTLMQQEKYDEAIAAFSKLIASKVNDYVVDPEKSDDYKSYRFRAALRLSDCYEAKKDFAHALEYAELARDRYKFMSYCKNCMKEARENLDKRIARLQAAKEAK